MQKIYLSAAAGAVLSALIGYFVLKGQFATDFVIFWSAHQVPNAYDVPALREAIVAAIGEERTPDTPWPFPYPPTFLLMTAWFGPLTLGAIRQQRVPLLKACVARRDGRPHVSARRNAGHAGRAGGPRAGSRRGHRAAPVGAHTARRAHARAVLPRRVH